MNRSSPAYWRRASTLPWLAAIAASSACSPQPAPPTGLPAVFVSPVRNKSASEQRVLHGFLRPRVEAELAFRIGGKVTARLVEVGQSVRAGQSLARIDPADYQLAVQAAEDQQRAAEVVAVQDASDAARFKRLLADGSVGAADVERQQARADAAAALHAQTIKQSELARNRASYAVLTAPFDGVITSVRFETGQMIDDSQSVLSVAQPGDLEVQVDVPESMVAGLSAWRASMLLGGTADVRVPLRLRELSPIATASTRTFRARYAFAASTPTDLRMGMTTEVQLQRPERIAGVELPIGALLVTAAAAGPPAATASNASAAVWVVDAKTGKLTRQSLRLVSQTTDRVRVTGLTDGALVVTVGAQKLDAGLKVRPVQRPLDVTRAAAR